MVPTSALDRSDVPLHGAGVAAEGAAVGAAALVQHVLHLLLGLSDVAALLRQIGCVKRRLVRCRVRPRCGTGSLTLVGSCGSTIPAAGASGRTLAFSTVHRSRWHASVWADGRGAP
jgi:hypothetical protein